MDWEQGPLSAATGGGSAPAGQGCRLLRHPTRVFEGPSQQHLDVGIEAAELVSGLLLRPSTQRSP
jgi:hypothetical protein